MPTTENYFPFGFKYPVGLAYSEANPDPMIQSVEERMAYLNHLHQKSGLPGHIFAAAIYKFQSESCLEPGDFWDTVRTQMTDDELVQIAQSLAPSVADEPERLDFPNAIALFDCRFVANREWVRIRRYSIGGSEASTVLQLSHFQSQLTLYYEKTCPPPENTDITWQQILDYGHDVEDYVIESICDRLGAVRYPEYRMFAHKDYPFLTCNPDGILFFPYDGHYALFEAKTCFWKKMEDWRNGIPEYYAPQPRHYLEVLNDPKLTEGYIGVCAGGLAKDLRCHWYTRDPIAGAEQVQKLVDYWQTHIVAHNPPSFSGHSDLDLDALYKYKPHATSFVSGHADETLPAAAIALFERYEELSEQRKDVNQQVAEAEKDEGTLLLEIISGLPEGITISTKEDGMTYEIKIKDSDRSSVKADVLKANHPAEYYQLMQMASRLKETTLNFNAPRISKKMPTAKELKALAAAGAAV